MCGKDGKEKKVLYELTRGKSGDQRCWVTEDEVPDREAKGWKKTGRSRSVRM